MSTTETTTADQPQESGTPESEGRVAIPRWFIKLYYCAIVPFCLLAAIYIGHSMIVQARLTGAIAVLEGVEQDPTEEDQLQAVRDLATRPVFSFQYLNQSLLQDKESDPRMAKALALRKALDWNAIYQRRQVIAEILHVMQETGEIPRGSLGTDWEGREVLRRMIDDRRALSNPTPAEQRITEVLVWIYRDRPTPPGGLERRRIKALQDAYQKRGFAPVEAEALQSVIDEWSASDNTVKTQAVERFRQILASQEVDFLAAMAGATGGEVSAAEQVSGDDAEGAVDIPSVDDVTLTGEVNELVQREMHAYEGAYERAMVRIARAARSMVQMINGPAAAGSEEGETAAFKGYELDEPEEKLFVDHPHIYQYLSLLGYRYEIGAPEKFEGVRELVYDGVYAMRRRKFTLYFLRYFGRKTAINPVMAVETERLTKEQHEREMRETNSERVRNAQKLMTDVFADYLDNPEAYIDKEDPQFDGAAEVQDYVRAKLIHPMQDLIEDPTFGEHARQQLEKMRQLAREHGVEDEFFRATVE